MNKAKIIEVMRYLTHKCESMTDVKLMKLMYFADRQSLLSTGYPITNDSFVSMNRGPVLSTAKDLLNGQLYLQYFLPLEEQNDNTDSIYPSVYAINLIDDEDFEISEMSTADLEILDDIIRKFGTYTTDAIVKFSHDNIPEWEYPHGSAIPIPISKILSLNGFDEETIQYITDKVSYHRSLGY